MERRSSKNTQRPLREQTELASCMITLIMTLILVAFSVCAAVSIATGVRSTAFELFGLITGIVIFAWVCKHA